MYNVGPPEEGEGGGLKEEAAISERTNAENVWEERAEDKKVK